MKRAAAAVALLIAGCSGTGDWSKPGADPAAVKAAYGECRDMAGAAVEPERGINQDIEATRQSDWQRGHLGQVESEAMHDDTRRRAGKIIAACMQAKGFEQGQRK